MGVAAASPLGPAGPADRASERFEARVVRRADRDDVVEFEREVRPFVCRLDVVGVYAVGTVPAEKPRGEAAPVIAALGGSS